MIISVQNEHALSESIRILKSGGIVVFPTETVYGVGALSAKTNAVEKIYKIKNRNRSKPLLLHISKSESLELAQYVPPEAIELVKRFWPGPLSLILKASDRAPRNVIRNGDTIGFRMPNNPFFQKLADAVGPIVATSANKSDNPSPVSIKSAYEQLGNSVDLYVDGGEIKNGIASTILDLSKDRPTVLRIGAISVSEIESVIGKVER